MHTFGKVLMFFVIIGAIAGTYLSARLLDTRDRWMDSVVDKSRQYEELSLKLDTARRHADERANEANQLQFGTNRYWDAPNSGPVQGPTIELGTGSNTGLGGTDAAAGRTPLVHLFYVNDEGGSQYLGQFVLDRILADRAGATLNRAPFPGETESWPEGRYRVRAAIQAPWGEEFVTLWSQYGSLLQNHDAELALETQQQQALADATTQLDERMQELEGHDEFPADAGLVERVGIVEAMRLAEISRDQILAQLDALRREYSEKWYRLDTMLDENRQRRQLLDGDVSGRVEVP